MSRYNNLVDELRKIDLAESEASDRGQGLDPLLQEFVYDVPSLSPEAKITRTRRISEYYQERYNSTHGNISIAYNQTRTWAQKTYVSHWVKKIRKGYGLPESIESHEYSNTQIKASKEIAEEVIKFGIEIPEEDLYTDPKDDQYGRELEPHITIKWGLTTNDPTEIENILDGSVSPFQIVFGEVSMFSEEDKPYDVLKVDMDAGENLEKLHDLFSKLDNEDSHPEYVPHMTVAYVKKGIGKKYVGDKHFVGLEMGVDCFEFKDTKGNSQQIILSSNEDNFDKVSPDPTKEEK